MILTDIIFGVALSLIFATSAHSKPFSFTSHHVTSRSGSRHFGSKSGSSHVGFRSHTVRDASPLEARQQANIITTGVTGSGVQPRLEIRELEQNADQFNIFMLAMDRFQNMDQNDRLSYFQLAGIHGRPAAEYDGVQGTGDPNIPGYCTHVSNLFATWHRPYLALYEQVVVANARDAAMEFPAGNLRNRYLEAASNLRLPYWDWAIAPPNGGSVIPPAIANQQVQVTTPSGAQTINNPLFSYRFHPVDAGLYYAPFTCLPQTTRWPTTTTCDATSQEGSADSNVDSNRVNVRDRLYNLLTQYTDYMLFSNEVSLQGQDGALGGMDSLESVHDAIHGAVGGPNYGYMSIIDVSAFDPIFWMHHAMVDRSFAIWQALHPNSYVQPQAAEQGTFTYARGAVRDANSPLTPFRSDSNGGFWTSNTVRDHTVFGYTYNDAQGGANAVKSRVNQLYGRSGALRVKRGTMPGYLANKAPGNGTLSPSNSTLSPSTDREYLCNIRAQKNGLDSSYFIHVFLGDPGEDPSKWNTHPDLVGTMSVISMRDPQKNFAVPISGVVPLTSCLEDRVAAGQLPSLGEVDVLPFLREKLHWRVSSMDGSNIDRKTVPDLLVSVASSEVQPATSETEFPKWVGGFTSHVDVTDGFPAGLSRDTSEALNHY